MSDIYNPENDYNIITGDPISYFDFEFEQFNINMEILKDLILDEIILANSEKCRKANRKLK